MIIWLASVIPNVVITAPFFSEKFPLDPLIYPLTKMRSHKTILNLFFFFFFRWDCSDVDFWQPVTKYQSYLESFNFSFPMESVNIFLSALSVEF